MAKSKKAKKAREPKVILSVTAAGATRQANTIIAEVPDRVRGLVFDICEALSDSSRDAVRCNIVVEGLGNREINHHGTPAEIADYAAVKAREMLSA